MLEESAVVVATQPPIRKPVSMYLEKKDIKNATVKELIEQGIIDPAVKNPEEAILEEAPVVIQGHLLQ